MSRTLETVTAVPADRALNAAFSVLNAPDINEAMDLARTVAAQPNVARVLSWSHDKRSAFLEALAGATGGGHRISAME